MADSLLEYYERELAFLRRSGAEFAKRYDKIAQRLSLEQDKCDDPHVERFLQGSAFLAARVHQRLDEEFPELTNAMLSLLFPQLLAPTPPISILQLVGKELPVTIKALTPLLTDPIVGTETSCRFRTAYPVRLLPITVRRTRFALPGDLGLPPDDSTQAVLVLELESAVLPFSALGLGASEAGRAFPHGEVPLRFYVSGPQQFQLYDLLLDHSYSDKDRRHMVQLRASGEKTTGVPIQLQPVGFHGEETLLPGGPLALHSYRLLREYFAFPKKFLFFDLCGLSKAMLPSLGNRLEVLFLLSREPARQLVLSPDCFRLGCTPIVNLFNHRCDEIHVDQTQVEYPIFPDYRRQSSMEIYSVDKVTAYSKAGEAIGVQPLFGLKYGSEDSGQRVLYTTNRRPVKDGTDVFLSLVDLGKNAAHPDWSRMHVRATCSNRSLAAALPIGGGNRISGTLRDMHPQGGDAEHISAVYCLERPTASYRPQLGDRTLWRLLSHLSINHLQLTDAAVLCELLKVYSLGGDEAVSSEIAGVKALSAQRVVARSRDGLPGFCRGLELTLKLDDDCYVGRSPFLFASVLERFFAEAVSVNSFTQLVLESQSHRQVRRWPPRAGEQILL